MILNLILLFIIYIIFIIYYSLKLFLGSESVIKNFNNTLAFLSVCTIIFNICLCLYIFYSLQNKKGDNGPKGIQGIMGKNGKDGICTAKCGQSACYSLVIEKVNKFLKDKNLGDIGNKFIMNKINKICFSDKYIGFLTSPSEKKPNEKTLIDYISDIVIEWVKQILSFKNGVKFLNTKELDESFYDKNITPFKEIKKFEIWDWGDPYRFKPIIRQQCSNKKELPHSEEAALEILYTNNYDEPVFVNKLNPTLYGPDDCNYNQLGEQKTNPRNTEHCYYYNDSTDNVDIKKTWKKEEYFSFSKDISFFNISKKTINNKTYYPVGTVWRGNNNIYKNEKKTSYGPPKETILISELGTQPPKDFELIWSTNDKICNNCIPSNNSFSIWRPIPPDNYVSLGDYITRGDLKPETNSIRCIPKKCVQEIKILDNSSVWTEEGFQKKEKSNPDSKAVIKEYSKRVSIWPVGITEKEEEITNISYKKINPLRIGGYNLFRSRDAHLKPRNSSGKGWEIIPSCYNIVKTDDPKIPSNDLGIGWIGGKKRENKYSVFSDLKYTLTGIITNNDIKNNKKGGCYIDHVKENLYNIKTFNTKSKKFDINLVLENNSLWNINMISEKDYIIKLSSSSGNKCLTQIIETTGEIKYKLDKCESGGTNWAFTPSTGFSL